MFMWFEFQGGSEIFVILNPENVGYLPNFAIVFLSFFKKFLLIWILSEKWKWKIPFLSEI